jgi:hypothetical protein
MKEVINFLTLTLHISVLESGSMGFWHGYGSGSGSDLYQEKLNLYDVTITIKCPQIEKLIFFVLFYNFSCKCLDCLMIFNIELPFSLNKTRIRNRIRIRIRAYDVQIRIQEAKKYGSGSIYFFSTDILYHFLSDCGVRENFSQKVFAKSFRKKFSQKTFAKSFCEKLSQKIFEILQKL